MKKILCTILTLSFILLLSSLCFAQERYIELGNDDKMSFYLDSETITIEEDNVDCWIKFLYTDKGQKQNENKNIKYSLEHYIFFPDRLYCILQIVDFDKNGNCISDYTVPEDGIKAESTIPDTAGEDIWKYLYEE